jgi:hypothetical protein
MANDYFLTKIYESLENRPPSTPKTPPKKFQSLSEVYHQVVFKKLNEDTEILMQQKGSDNVEEFTVSDDLAKQIKSNIKKETLFATAGNNTNLNEIIKKVLTISNWAKTSNINFLIENVSNTFNKEELLVDNIIKYPDFLQNSKNLLKEKLLNNPSSKINLKDLIPEWFHSFFENLDGTNVINNLWNLVPNTKPASGRGELALTLISSSKKASQGDLLIDNELIEMKGSGGTMGGDNHIIDTSTELNEIVKQDLTGISKTNRKQNLIFRLKKTIPTKYETLRNEISSLIDKDATTEEIKNVIDKSNLTDKNKENLNKTLVSSLTIPKFNYRDSLLAFFSQYELLSDEQLAGGVFAGRNYKKVTSPESVKNKIKNIILSDKNTIFQKHHQRHFTRELSSLIAALHLCSYQEVYKFKGIIFVNDNSKDMVYYQFRGNEISQNLEDVYSFLLQFKPTINLAMTQIQKAAGFDFFTNN